MFKKLNRILINLTKIDQAIAAESTRRWPDTMRLLRLKSLKLSVKNRLWHLMQPAPALVPVYAQNQTRKGWSA